MHKPKLANILKEMQERHLDHAKKEMNGIEAIGEITKFRCRRVKQQNHMNYKSEYDPLIGSYPKLMFAIASDTKLNSVNKR